MFCRLVCLHGSWFRPLILPHCQRRIWDMSGEKNRRGFGSGKASLDGLYKQKLVTIFSFSFFCMSDTVLKKNAQGLYKNNKKANKSVQIVTLMKVPAFPALETAISG